MVVEWLGPTLTAYRHRSDIRDLLAGGMARLFGKKTALAFTGMQGVGKTVLLDHLTGKAFDPEFQLPPQSQGMESGRVLLRGKRIYVSVVPGQDANPRHLALDQLFKARPAVQGVVHVVGHGYASLRNPGAVNTLIRDLRITTVAKFRTYQLDQELTDLETTCEAIRSAHQKNHAPRWLIVAVNKVDLYEDTIAKARAYYSPEADSPFAERLRTLGRRVGTDFFRWETVPVCSCLESFQWHRQEVVPQFDAAMRDAYLAQFLRELASYCA